MEKSDLRVSFVSTYPPRECGIATYTVAVSRVMNNFFLKRKTKVVAITNNGYRYPEEVHFEIDQENQKSYKEAAEFINNNQCEVVSIQHEYGIFGGEHGEYVLDLMENLNKPIALTLHSVIPEHPPKRKEITQRMLTRADAVIVMTNTSKQMLLEHFDVEANKIHVVMHGVPNVRPDRREATKRKFGLQGRFIMSTFGLINRGKGIEYALDSLQKIIKEVPNALYLVIGKTHPVVKKHEGESYREFLMDKVRKKGLTGHVKFVNKYLNYHELVDYLRATDVYVAPQVDPNQSASGTVAYAIGTGASIIATPTSYASEVLANGRGYFVDFKDSKGIADKVIRLAKSPQLRENKQLKTYLYGRRMIWPVVGLAHLRVFEHLAYGKASRPKIPIAILKEAPELIPS